MSADHNVLDAAKAIPAITVSGMTIAGISMQEWLVLLTAVYTLLQIVLLVRRLITARRADDADNEDDPDCAADCPVARRVRR